jgi:hypothetical protein
MWAVLNGSQRTRLRCEGVEWIQLAEDGLR